MRLQSDYACVYESGGLFQAVYPYPYPQLYYDCVYEWWST